MIKLFERINWKKKYSATKKDWSKIWIVYFLFNTKSCKYYIFSSFFYSVDSINELLKLFHTYQPLWNMALIIYYNAYAKHKWTMAIHIVLPKEQKDIWFFRIWMLHMGQMKAKFWKIISLFVSLRRTKKIDLNQNLLKENDQIFDSKKVY